MLKRLLKAAKRERARCNAMLLLVCLFLPFAQLTAASTQAPEASLPTCCRSHGKHKCFTRTSQVQSDHQTTPAFHTAITLTEKCPCIPANNGSSSHSASGFLMFRGLRLPLAETAVSGLDRTSALRLNSYRANQKRGPPSVSSNS